MPSDTHSSDSGSHADGDYHPELNHTELDREVYSHHECIECGARQVVEEEAEDMPLAYGCPPHADDQHCLKLCLFVAISNKGEQILPDEEVREHAI